MFAELRSLLSNKSVLLLGVGNRLRGDDAIGPLLIDHLQGKINFPMMDVGDVPENYLGPIEESGAEVILVIDAVDMGAKAGETAVFDIQQIQGKSMSTHTANLGLLFKAIRPESRPQVLVLGIQPEGMELGQELSKPVSKTLKVLTEIFISWFPQGSFHT